jgi:hypothetical protein
MFIIAFDGYFPNVLLYDEIETFAENLKLCDVFNGHDFKHGKQTPFLIEKVHFPKK